MANQTELYAFYKLFAMERKVKQMIFYLLDNNGNIWQYKVLDKSQ
jgi:hypothetical protein